MHSLLVLLIFPYITLAKAVVAGRASLLAMSLGIVSYLFTQAWALMSAIIALTLPLNVGHLLTQNWFCLMTVLAYASIFSLAM